MGDGRSKPDRRLCGRPCAKGGDGGDGLAEGVLALVVVVARHGGRAMAYDALNHGQRNAGVGGEGDECVPEGVEGGDDGLAAASLHLDTHGDVGGGEDPPDALVQFPVAVVVEVGNHWIHESCEG